jgi:hypothetical protein
VDPHLFLKEVEGKRCIVTLYVENSFIACAEGLKKEKISKTERVLSVKVQENLDDYHSVKWSETKKVFVQARRESLEI